MKRYSFNVLIYYPSLVFRIRNETNAWPGICPWWIKSGRENAPSKKNLMRVHKGQTPKQVSVSRYNHVFCPLSCLLWPKGRKLERGCWFFLPWLKLFLPPIPTISLKKNLPLLKVSITPYKLQGHITLEVHFFFLCMNTIE